MALLCCEEFTTSMIPSHPLCTTDLDSEIWSEHVLNLVCRVLSIVVFVFWLCWVLRCCPRAFSSYTARGGFSLVATSRLLITVASLITGSGACGLSSCGAQAELLCGIFQDQGSNPYPLGWKVDSLPLVQQRSPVVYIFKNLSN